MYMKKRVPILILDTTSMKYFLILEEDVFSGKIQVLSLLFGICEAGEPC